jgi:hypothetical protein
MHREFQILYDLPMLEPLDRTNDDINQLAMNHKRTARQQHWQRYFGTKSVPYCGVFFEAVAKSAKCIARCRKLGYSAIEVRRPSLKHRATQYLRSMDMTINEIALALKCTPRTVYRARAELNPRGPDLIERRLADIQERIRTLEYQMFSIVKLRAGAPRRV